MLLIINHIFMWDFFQFQSSSHNCGDKFHSEQQKRQEIHSVCHKSGRSCWKVCHLIIIIIKKTLISHLDMRYAWIPTHKMQVNILDAISKYINLKTLVNFSTYTRVYTVVLEKWHCSRLKFIPDICSKEALPNIMRIYCIYLPPWTVVWQRFVHGCCVNLDVFNSCDLVF